MIPQVSVIIPAYNCDRYITEAVESALNQKADQQANSTTANTALKGSSQLLETTAAQD